MDMQQLIEQYVNSGMSVEQANILLSGSGSSGLSNVVPYNDGAPTSTENPMPFVEHRGAIANVTAVPAADYVQSLLEASATRHSWSVFNDSASSTLYIRFGSGAGYSSFSVRVKPGGFYECPKPMYIGPVSGIWDGYDGFARITETE